MSRNPSAAVFAALACVALTACSDSSAPAVTLTPQETQQVGAAVATEVELSLASLQPEDAVNAVISVRPASRGGGLVLARGGAARPLPGTLFANEAPCGAASQQPIVDTDDDTVPDDATFVFTLPACHFDFGESSIDVTGTVRIVDPTPAVAGLAFNITLGALRFAFSDPQGSGSITRDGTQSVRIAGSGLSQSHDFTLAAELTGEDAVLLESEWGASFVPAQGQSIVFGQPLPSGTYTPGGTTRWTRGDNEYSFTLVTHTPLAYDRDCLGELSLFRSGELHVALSGTEGRAYVRIRYADCGEPEVVFVGTNA
ncbi:MAG: hypothetical protein ACREON_11960 [Gemmatimonadaceae bacterium]